MVVLEIAPLLRRNQSAAIIKGSFCEWIAQFRLALPFDIDDETNGRFVFGASTSNRVSNTTLPSLVVACSDEVTFAASSAFVSSSSTVVSPYMGSNVRCFSTISSMLQSENSSVQPFGMWASTYFFVRMRFTAAS